METLKRPDPERLHVLAAKLRLLLLNVCVWLAGWLHFKLPREARIMLREDIRDLLFGARLLIFLLAMTRRERSPLKIRTERPPSTPPGFHRTDPSASGFRRFKRIVRLRGRTSLEKLAELRALFDNLSKWSQRVLTHVIACHGLSKLVICCVVAERPRGLITQTPAFADSS